MSTENWQLTQSNQIFVPPHKRGNAKLIDTILIPPVILQAMQDGRVWKFEGSLKTYQRLFKTYSGLTETHVGRKKLLLHTFRHVFIKRMNDDGRSTQEINAMLGIRRSITTMQYIYKQYDTEPYIPIN